MSEQNGQQPAADPWDRARQILESDAQAQRSQAQDCIDQARQLQRRAAELLDQAAKLEREAAGRSDLLGELFPAHKREPAPPVGDVLTGSPEDD